jgi:putative peptide zinc metalloprotease protein
MNLDGLHGLQQRLTVDTSEAQPVYLLKSPKGNYLRLSQSAYQLLNQLSLGVTFEQLAEALTRKQGQPVTPADIERAYQNVMERIERIDNQSSQLPFGFWFKTRLLPAPLVRRISNVLAVAFRGQVAFILLCGIMLAMGWHGLRGGPLQLTPAYFWQAYALFLLSLAMHEFGHASACARHGAPPHDIGFTVYLIYPSFYSDVSSAWQLKRWQRVVVDLGGIYFQLVTGAFYVLAYALWGWEPLRLAVWIILASCLFSLNPIFKFDGYWVVADALGVTHLSQQPQRLVRHFLGWLRKRPMPALPWSNTVLAVLLLYSVLSIAFWGWFLVRLSPMLEHHLREYPKQIAALVASPPSQLLGALQSLAISTFMLLILGMMVVRLVRPVFNFLRRRWLSRVRPRHLHPPLSRS